MNAALLAEAVDAVVALYRALAVWLLIAAVVCALLSLATVAGVAYTVRALRAAWARRGAWRWLSPPQTPSRDSRATGPTPKPSDGRTAARDYREAA